MNISLMPEVFETLPKLRLGIVVIHDIDNKSKLPASAHLVQDAEKLIRLTFHKDTTKTHYLIAPWEAARREFGKEARHYHTALEKLLHQVLEGKSAVGKDVLTNIVHYLMLKHLVPMALDDRSKVQGRIIFDLVEEARKNEGPKAGPLQLKRLQLKKGELYYRDEQKILGAKLDYWKNPVTALTSSTTNAILHIETLPPVTRGKLRGMLIETEQLITSFCGGRTKTALLWRKKRSVTL
ncbi:MAG: phenylalanine--tRNA ligase beta subunit-related protein [Nanoarchaeota archaeon]